MVDMFAMKPYTRSSERFVEELVERLYGFLFFCFFKSLDPGACWLKLRPDAICPGITLTE